VNDAYDMPVSFVTKCALATTRLGYALGSQCCAPRSLHLAPPAPVHATILLAGPVGVGKSAFAAGFIRGCLVAHGSPESENIVVASPSFSIVIPYYANDGTVVHHLDLFRLSGDRDAHSLKLPALFRSSVCIVEWPERVRALWPQNSILVSLDYTSDTSNDSEPVSEIEKQLAHGVLDVGSALSVPWEDLDAVPMPRKVTICGV
jgi:tRNA threonylcarbamoyl adenosine modification protein YjeE